MPSDHENLESRYASWLADQGKPFSRRRRDIAARALSQKGWFSTKQLSQLNGVVDVRMLAMAGLTCHEMHLAGVLYAEKTESGIVYRVAN